MGGNSSSGQTSSGLSSLFLGNQASPEVGVPTITAPQRQSLPGVQQAVAQAPALSKPPAYTPPAPELTGVQKMLHDYYYPPFQPDPGREGYGWMQTFAGTEHGMPMYDRHYVSAPMTQAAPQVAAAPARSQAQLLAEAINQQAQQRGR
jgi:hypothetical protein